MTPRSHWRGHHNDALVPQPPSSHTVPDIHRLNDTCFNQNPESDSFVNFDSLTRSNTPRNENTTVVGDSSAVLEANNLPSSNADTRGKDSVGQGTNPFPNDFDNAAGNWSPSQLYPPRDGYSTNPVYYGPLPTPTYNGPFAQNGIIQQQSSLQPHDPCDGYRTNPENYTPAPTSIYNGHFAQNGIIQQQSSPYHYTPRDWYPTYTENYGPSPTSTYNGHFAQNGIIQQQSSPYHYTPRDGYPTNTENYRPSPTSTYHSHFAQNGLDQQQMQQCTILNNQYDLPSLRHPPYGLAQRYPNI